MIKTTWGKHVTNLTQEVVLHLVPVELLDGGVAGHAVISGGAGPGLLKIKAAAFRVGAQEAAHWPTCPEQVPALLPPSNTPLHTLQTGFAPELLAAYLLVYL